MKKQTQDLDLLKSMIYIADAYRAIKLLDLKRIDRAIEKDKISEKIKREWSKARKIMDRMTVFVTSLPGVSKWVRRRMFLDLAAMTILTGIIIFLTADLIIGTKFSETYEQFPPLLLICAMTIWLAARISGAKAGSIIERYFEENPKKFEAERNYLAKFVQMMIDEYSREIRIMKIDPNKKPLMLYNIDYKRVKVKKKPGFMRKSYLVTVM